MRVFIKLIILIFFIFFIFFISCDNKQITEEEQIKEMINSDDPGKIVEGYYIIGNEKRNVFIKDAFLNATDSRISHQYKFKGISVYQSKMIALKKISGLTSPVLIKHKADSVVIKFYYNWAVKNNYITPQNK